MSKNTDITLDDVATIVISGEHPNNQDNEALTKMLRMMGDERNYYKRWQEWAALVKETNDRE